MQILAVEPKNDEIRGRFFDAVLGESEGYICFAVKLKTKNPDPSKNFPQKFFSWPSDRTKVLSWINSNFDKGDMYFCPQLLSEAKRRKVSVKACPNLWADLDEVDPATVAPRPTIAVESSPGRWQSYWRLEDNAEPLHAEDACRRLTYVIDADKSGWDLTQLLRVPLTYNFKRENPNIVRILWIDNGREQISTFLTMPKPSEEIDGFDGQPFPEKEILALPDPASILLSYRYKLPASFRNMYTNITVDDRSSVMWAMETVCLEAGMSLEETFRVVNESPLNKYKQDGRPLVELWKEICKAQAARRLHMEYAKPVEIEGLLTAEELKRVKAQPKTFVEDYIEWAKTRTDAAPQYHEAAAFIILSAILSQSLELPMSFGMVRPNIWFMILADSTMSRKTTAMEMAMDTLNTVFEDALLATDGSVEGIMAALALRPNRTSVFMRDEISGLVEGMKKKDYMAGLVEAFSRWYEGKTDIRVLKKERIEVRDPRFIIFAGGIKTRMLEILDQDFIINGFIPRFLFVTADADLEAYRAPTLMQPGMLQVSTELIKYLSELVDRYSETILMKIGDQNIEYPKKWELGMTEDAIKRYGVFEQAMNIAGAASDEPMLYSPTLDRMAKSGLKISMLIAASRQIDREKITIELDDMLRAIYYINKWKEYTIEIVENAGKRGTEHTLERAFMLIKKGKETRSDLMRSMHLTAKDADWIIETLVQRGQVISTKHGKLERLYATSV